MEGTVIVPTFADDKDAVYFKTWFPSSFPCNTFIFFPFPYELILALVPYSGSMGFITVYSISNDMTPLQEVTVVD